MHASIKKACSEIAIATSLASILVAQDIAGTWRGILEPQVGTQNSEQQQVVWKLMRSGVEGLMVTSYSVNPSHPPIVGSLVLRGQDVVVSFPTEGSKYEGYLQSGGVCIVGTFTGSTSRQLTLSRADETDAWLIPDSLPAAFKTPKDAECSANRTGPVTSARQGDIHWGTFFREWWLDITVEQAYRVSLESKTRAQLDGKFFQEWFSDVAQYRYGLWNDGDRFFTSYLGHPLQGAVVEGIFWQNNDRVRFSDQSFHSAAYRKALLQAFAFATLDAVQWKLGPVSEASIGHVGLPAHWWDVPYYCNLTHAYCHPRTGLNDLVMNEVGGTVLTIGFQWTDKHVQIPIEKRIHNRAVIDTTRIFSNPPQSLANLLRFRRPWFRDNRDGLAPLTP